MIGKTIAVVLASILSTGFSILMPPAYELRWMSGHWIHAAPGGAWAEEYWTEPRSDIMLGTGLSGKGLEVTSFEFMRIQGATFWGSPKGKPPVPFRIVEMERNFVAFENREHDYPTRISYRLEGKMMVATTSGPGGSNLQTWRYRRVRD
jgi:hypothetical protein